MPLSLKRNPEGNFNVSGELPGDMFLGKGWDEAVRDALIGKICDKILADKFDDIIENLDFKNLGVLVNLELVKRLLK